MNVCVYVCVYVCMYVSMYVCMYFGLFCSAGVLFNSSELGFDVSAFAQ